VEPYPPAQLVVLVGWQHLVLALPFFLEDLVAVLVQVLVVVEVLLASTGQERVEEHPPIPDSMLGAVAPMVDRQLLGVALRHRVGVPAEMEPLELVQEREQLLG
jgi:hypothetical protein